METTKQLNLDVKQLKLCKQLLGETVIVDMSKNPNFYAKAIAERTAAGQSLEFTTTIVGVTKLNCANNGFDDNAGELIGWPCHHGSNWAKIAINSIVWPSPEKSSTDLPRYKCHKEVSAAKIVDIKLSNQPSSGVAALIVQPLSCSPIYVSQDYMAKHKPKVGGYYVRYDDGYESFSPADVFEQGYTII